jgi:hypothetical protein
MPTTSAKPHCPRAKVLDEEACRPRVCCVVASGQPHKSGQASGSCRWTSPLPSLSFDLRSEANCHFASVTILLLFLLGFPLFRMLVCRRHPFSPPQHTPAGHSITWLASPPLPFLCNRHLPQPSPRNRAAHGPHEPSTWDLYVLGPFVPDPGCVPRSRSRCSSRQMRRRLLGRGFVCVAALRPPHAPSPARVPSLAWACAFAMPAIGLNNTGA